LNPLIELIIVIVIFVLSKSLSEKSKIEGKKKIETWKLDNKNFEKEKKEVLINQNETKTPIYKSKMSYENKTEYDESEDSLEKKLVEWESELYAESEFEKDAYEKDIFNYDEAKASKIYSELEKDILKGVIFSEIISKTKIQKRTIRASYEALIVLYSKIE
jgi:hypothetical protein